MSEKVMFSAPQEIPLSEEIDNPDQYIDQFIEGFKDNPEAKMRLEVLKGLDHEEKVRWLLSLDDEPKRDPGLITVCTLVMVYVCVMVVVGYIVANGVSTPVKEKRCEEKEVKKCVTQPKP